MSVYGGLPLGPKQIRLGTVTPLTCEPDDSTIHCDLEVVSLNGPETKPEYYALSYTWGARVEYGRLGTMTSELKCEITCNGDKVLVTENVRCFLERLRGMSKLLGKKFWI